MSFDVQMGSWYTIDRRKASISIGAVIDLDVWRTCDDLLALLRYSSVKLCAFCYQFFYDTEEA